VGKCELAPREALGFSDGTLYLGSPHWLVHLRSWSGGEAGTPWGDPIGREECSDRAHTSRLRLRRLSSGLSAIRTGL